MLLFRRLRGRAPLKSVHVEPVTFSSGALTYPDDAFTVPVLVVSYFPARGDSLQREITGDVGGSLSTVREHTMQVTAKVVEALELGSVYHGYRDSSALPSLRYRIVGTAEFLEGLPCRVKPGHALPLTNYAAIADQIELRSWVEQRGVKEVWLWGYHGGVVDLWESNMAGPYGDISNSDRDPTDLPIYSSTYTMYHYNYARGASEAVEDHMHQIEAVLRHIDPHMFWDRFVGKPREGRCGWAHFPPNGERDYDWANRKPVATDIEDWNPDGGPRKLLNCERWRCDSLTWFIYWMQNLPGRDNNLTFRGRSLTNWWRFIGDWDGSMSGGAGLVD